MTKPNYIHSILCNEEEEKLLDTLRDKGMTIKQVFIEGLYKLLRRKESDRNGKMPTL